MDLLLCEKLSFSQELKVWTIVSGTARDNDVISGLRCCGGWLVGLARLMLGGYVVASFFLLFVTAHLFLYLPLVLLSNLK